MMASVSTLWLTADQAAEYLGLPSRNCLYQMVRAGEIPAYRLGERRLRFKKEELDMVLEKKRCMTFDDLDILVG